MVYPALLPLMRTPRLPVVDWTDAPADLNGLVRFAERRNIVSVRVSSHFNKQAHCSRCIALKIRLSLWNPLRATRCCVTAEYFHFVALWVS